MKGSSRLFRSLRRCFSNISFGWVQFGQATVSIVGQAQLTRNVMRCNPLHASNVITVEIYSPWWSRLRDVGNPHLPRLPRYMLSSEALGEHETLVPTYRYLFSATLLGTPKSRPWYISLLISAFNVFYISFEVRIFGYFSNWIHLLRLTLEICCLTLGTQMDFVTEAMLCKVFRPVAGFSNSLAMIVAVAIYIYISLHGRLHRRS